CSFPVLYVLIPSILFFFFSIRPPPRSPLFPYTTLFRSEQVLGPGGRCSDLKYQHGPGFPCGKQQEAIEFRGPHGDARRLERQRRSEEHTSELQSHLNLVCRLLLEKKKK